MSQPTNNYLFNFTSSYSGGGYRILESYLDYFEKNGGATFLLNSKLKDKLPIDYNQNRLIFCNINKIFRLFNDEYYISPVIRSHSKFDLYFAYGIPIYKKIARINWFHVSNLIPVNSQLGFVNLNVLLQMKFLGYRIKKYILNADILSADSKDGLNQTLNFTKIKHPQTFVLKNGINKNFLSYKNAQKKQPVAVTVGTQPYKDLISVYNIFKQTRENDNISKLLIIGAPNTIPKSLKNKKDVIITGELPYDKVLEQLSRSKIYISASKIENSSIASLEGLYLCEKSYLSTIGSHQELVEYAGAPHKTKKLGETSVIEAVNSISTESFSHLQWDTINAELHNLIKQQLRTS